MSDELIDEVVLCTKLPWYVRWDFLPFFIMYSLLFGTLLICEGNIEKVCYAYLRLFCSLSNVILLDLHSVLNPTYTFNSHIYISLCAMVGVCKLPVRVQG